MVLREILRRPMGKLPVRGVLVIDVEPTPIEAATVEPIHWRVGCLQKAAEAVVVVPRGGLILCVVERLAPTNHFIAVPHEVLRQRHSQRHSVAPDVAVAVTAGRGGAHAGHHARP